jgi:hypothetical protein
MSGPSASSPGANTAANPATLGRRRSVTVIEGARDVDALMWINGIARALAYTHMAPPEVVALRAIEQWAGVAIGVADGVTAECELWGDWDIPGSTGEIVWRCGRGKERAWQAWRAAASAETLEIADILAEDWSLGTAALAETAELLAYDNPR